MNRFITTLCLLVAATLSLHACTTTDQGEKQTIDMKGKKVLVAYFSWSGNTREAAQYIALKTGADEFEISRRATSIIMVPLFFLSPPSKASRYSFNIGI